MNPICPNCGIRMRRFINPQGYWCPGCKKIIKDKKGVKNDRINRT